MVSNSHLNPLEQDTKCSKWVRNEAGNKLYINESALIPKVIGTKCSSLFTKPARYEVIKVGTKYFGYELTIKSHFVPS